MSDIRPWLEELGLDQYADAFEANEIDQALLPDLTDDDLEKLGVAVMGHRKRLLKAIGDIGQITEQPVLESDGPDRPAPSATAVERRQLTVMFCDLVGSTTLSEQLDPEDLRTLMQAYQEAAGRVIERYDGHVAQYLGDGLMVYFGWPTAHEDDTQRAVRAALEVVEAVKVVEAPGPLQVRVGIATGPVVVGETGGGDASIPKLAVGETPNLAARLQALAGADEIVIGSTARRLIEGTVELIDLGQHTLKGIVEPVHAWRVVGVAASEDRFEATRGLYLTPLVGRDEELALLVRRWRQAEDGEGQVVLIEGEAGIGKSRLIVALRDAVRERGGRVLRPYQCSPYHSNTAFYVPMNTFAQDAGFTTNDTAEVKLDKLDEHLQQLGMFTSETASVLAQALSIPIDGRYPKINLSPQKQRDLTAEAIADRILIVASQEQPVLGVIEDLHWSDPSSLEALERAIPRLVQSRMLMILTFRPEFEPSRDLTSGSHVSIMSLSGLSRRHSSELVTNVTGRKRLPDEVLDQIVFKTDGVPLFVEELTKSVLESGTETTSAIPETLQDSLMARLDKLSSIKEVAQIGACIGREFSHELLASISPLHDNALYDALQQLVNSELIYRHGTPPTATYTFKHALVQDTAYETLLKSRRQKIHAKIAGVLETQCMELSDSEPEIFAHHFSAAEDYEKAADYWLAAGRSALMRVAFPETVSHLENGLQAIANLPESPDKSKREMSTRTVLGAAYMATKGWASQEVSDTYDRAHELARVLEARPELVITTWGRFTYALTQGEVCRALSYGEAAVELGDRIVEPNLSLIGHAIMANSLFCLGEFEGARAECETVLATYDLNQSSVLVASINHDPASVIGAYYAQTLWILGYPEQALKALLTEQRHSAAIGHAFNRSFTLLCGGVVHSYRGESGRLETDFAESGRIAEETGILLLRDLIAPAWATFDLCRSNLDLTREEWYRRGVEGWRDSGGKLYLPYYAMCFALGLQRVGRSEAAEAMRTLALETQGAIEDRGFHADITRIEGELALLRGPADPEFAEDRFQESLEIARRQKARGWELRTALSLARLWRSQGKTKQSHDLLAPVYDWFTEGFDTADLKDAKALLDELK